MPIFKFNGSRVNGGCIMKKEYIKPVLEITRFEAHDVITASSTGNMVKMVNEDIERKSGNIKSFEEFMK